MNQMTDKHRLQILSAEEIDDIYGIPRFNDEERDYFFSLDTVEKHACDQLKSPEIKCLFTLQLAYFKAKRIFFALEREVVQADINYLKKDFPKLTVDDILSVSSSTKNRQHQMIMKIYGYRSLYGIELQTLEDKTKYFASISVKPSFVFRELLKYLSDSKTILPSYPSMQDLIGKILQIERKKIEDYFNKKLTYQAKLQLDSFLTIENKEFSLVKIKNDSKDFSHTQIKREIEKRQKLIDIYMFSNKILSKHRLSNETIKYYASFIDHYSSNRLSKLPKAQFYLYMSCFARFKVHKINNNLIKAFMYLVDNYVNEAKDISKDEIVNFRTTSNMHLSNVAAVWEMFVDEEISNNEVFGRVRSKAFDLVKKEEFPGVKKLILEKTFNPDEFIWSAYEKLAGQFKKNLRIIFLNIDFMTLSNNDLTKAIKTVKQLLLEGKSLRKSDILPTKFIPSHLKKYISPKDNVISDRYEFYLYNLIRERLDSGDVYSSESIDFRNFEDDLISDNYFKENWKKLLNEAGLEKFTIPVEDYLDKQDEKLHLKFLKVNKSLKNNTNKNLSQYSKKGETRWKLKYVKTYNSNNQQFYKSLPQSDIYQVMRFVDSQTKFTEDFDHIAGKESKPNIKKLFASIIGLGINAGLSKMSKMSNIGYSDLELTMSNFVNLENIKKSIDTINNATAKLSTFSLYTTGGGIIHSSSDGQKFETRYPTMKSRYSKKYFGLKKGVSAYSLIIQGIPANAMVIGANEHESHFVFDIIHNNSSDIQTDLHSTDSHGINKANFFLLNAFGCQFSPRINNPNDKIYRLTSFRDLRSYKDCLITPAESVDRNLISLEWPNILRILVSLATKTTTQNIIVKKLSSHKRQNLTKEAIWELDRIHESKYILDYIDDETIPQNVQKSLNQGEQYHGLRRAIGGYGGLDSKSDLELEVWNECSRLITSIIIYYNYYILSQLVEYLKKNNPSADLNFLKKISPIAWIHVNLLGRYDFEDETVMDIQKIINIASMLI